MNVEQLLQNEIKDSQRWIEVEKDESTCKRNLKIRVELINWVLENMKNSDTDICSVIETKMNEIIGRTFHRIEVHQKEKEESGKYLEMNWIKVKERSLMK